MLSDEGQRNVSWLTRRRYHRILARHQPDALAATVETSLVNNRLLVTSVDYNGKRCEIERLFVDTHADDALAVAGRIRTRNEIFEQTLTDRDKLTIPSADTHKRSLEQQAVEQEVKRRAEQTQLFRDIIASKTSIDRQLTQSSK